VVTDNSGAIAEASINIEVSLLSETKIVASDGDVEDYFGYSVAVSSDGNTAASGSYLDDDMGEDSGSVYLYRRDGSSWPVEKITASDGETLDQFGCDVSLSSDGNVLAVGSLQDSDLGKYSGAVYIYRWNGTSWAEEKVVPSDGAALDYFGNKVSLSSDGNTLAAGSYQDDDMASNSGSAYIFRWDGTSWNEWKVTASDGVENEYFGETVSISPDGNTLAVGLLRDDDLGTDSGSVYIYRWDGTSWIEQKVTASDGAEGDNFGSSVALSHDGNILAVGAYLDEGIGTNSGSVYVYRWDGSDWDEERIITSDGANGDRFGCSISISPEGNTLGAGAVFDNIDSTSFAGSAYIYKWNGTAWIEKKLIHQDIDEWDYFGSDISISQGGNTVVVGGNRDSYNGEYMGSIYIYR
jgi:hypothetical protein